MASGKPGVRDNADGAGSIRPERASHPTSARPSSPRPGRRSPQPAGPDPRKRTHCHRDRKRRPAYPAPSWCAAARRSSRSAGPGGPGQGIARPPDGATTPCAHHVTAAARCGNGGPDTTPAVAPMPRCAVPVPWASASPQGCPDRQTRGNPPLRRSLRDVPRSAATVVPRIFPTRVTPATIRHGLRQGPGRVNDAPEQPPGNTLPWTNTGSVAATTRISA